jgi:hypothetical protein
MGLGFCSQPAGHIVAGELAWKMSGKFADKEWKQAKPVIQPLAAIGSHIVMDKMIGEAGLGEYQVGIGITRATIGYFLQKTEKEKDDYLQYAFWSLLPDILQKGFGWNWAHPEISGPKVFELNRDNNELLEEMFLASLIFHIKLEL